MIKVALMRKSIILLTSFVALSALNGPSATFATGATITMSPVTAYFIPGTYSNSGATLSQAVDSSATSILISDRSKLGEGWTVKVDDELMHIEQLIDGAQYNDPDTMVVTRHVNGSPAASHANGRAIKTQTVTVNIYANGITSAGLGGFQIYMILPPQVQWGSLSWDSTWLSSTGRVPSCVGPTLTNGIWEVTCVTLESTPDGPTGSGLIGKATFLPSQTQGGSVVNFSQSQMSDIQGSVIPATVSNPSVVTMKCPDTNRDGRIDSGDRLDVALNMSDRGVDTGAITYQIDSAQTAIPISDQSKLAVGNTIGIDSEQMTVMTLHDGTPDTMNVTRPYNYTYARSHSAGTRIFKGTYAGRNGIMGYTDGRDVNNDGVLDSGDLLLIGGAMVNHLQCPQ